MDSNINWTDALVRIVMGVVLLSFVWLGPRGMWGLLGALPLVTGLVGWCPVYRLFGVSTAQPSVVRNRPRLT